MVQDEKNSSSMLSAPNCVIQFDCCLDQRHATPRSTTHRAETFWKFVLTSSSFELTVNAQRRIVLGYLTGLNVRKSVDGRQSRILSQGQWNGLQGIRERSECILFQSFDLLNVIKAAINTNIGRGKRASSVPYRPPWPRQSHTKSLVLHHRKRCGYPAPSCGQRTKRREYYVWLLQRS